jgi:hypothetical protein
LLGYDFLKDSIDSIFGCIISSTQLAVLVAAHPIHLSSAIHEDNVLLAGTKACDVFVYYPESDIYYCTEFALLSRKGTFPHPIKYLFDYFCWHMSYTSLDFLVDDSFFFA